MQVILYLFGPQVYRVNTGILSPWHIVDTVPSRFIFIYALALLTLYP